MSQESVEVSVIIPVFNEEKYVGRCIRSLIDQSYPRNKMEWLFVDGASTDNTVSIIKGYESTYPIQIFINEKRKTPISVNIGIKKARGQYIIRMDAHAEFPNDYIEKCMFNLQHTDADNVGGYVTTKAEGFTGSAIAKMLSSRFGVGGSSFRTGDASGYVDTVPFGAFKKTVFDKIGLFNENLLRSEDNDMNSRIRENGGKIYLARDIVSTYYCRDSIPGVLKMGLQNGNALFRTIRINSTAMSLRHFIPFAFFLSIVFLPLAGIKFSFFHYLFLSEIICYLLLDSFFSFIKAEAKYGVVTIWLYPLFHISYGLGSLLGLFGVELY